MKVSVLNTHSSAVEAAGIVFAPRREVELDLDEEQLEALRANRHLGLAYEGAGAEVAGEFAAAYATAPEGGSESPPQERCRFGECTYTGTAQQVRGHRLSHRGDG